MDRNGKFKNASFWLGAMSRSRESDSEKEMAEYVYQDGSTPVRFHHLQMPNSMSNGTSAYSGIPVSV
jgi:hypothetical protein